MQCINKIEDYKESQYYLNTLDEINELKKIFKESQSTNQKVFNYQNDREGYINFLNLIDRVVKNRKSFILKYINVISLRMSSGERAFLNFFSWLNLIPYFKYVSSHQMTENISTNVLLLIDEIDLYCHPEWQRKMINNLLDELKSQFKEKRIQVIFTTHSPIVLSDIPLSNSLYIRRINEMSSKIDDRTRHKQTFASNIYQLFNDSFFLDAKSTIGEYALARINEVLNRINNMNANENIDDISSMINLIGEPIISNKLYNKLSDNLMDNSKRNLSSKSNWKSKDTKYNYVTDKYGKLSKVDLITSVNQLEYIVKILKKNIE